MTNKKPGNYVAIYAALHTTTAKNMLIINLHRFKFKGGFHWG